MAKQNRKSVAMYGEMPMIEEFGQIFTAHGFLPLVITEGKKNSLPKGIQQINKVPRNISCGIELTNIDLEKKKERLVRLDRSIPKTVPILSSSLTITITEQSRWVQYPERLIGIGALPSLLSGKLVELAPSVKTDRTIMSRAAEMIQSFGMEVSIVQDRIGLVLPRILVMLINEAFFALSENTASGPDIDIAMKLGTNYPFGPVEWAQRIGLQQVTAVLSALQQEYDDDRYRQAPLLRQLTRSL